MTALGRVRAHRLLLVGMLLCAAFSPRIWGGQEAETCQWPSVVALGDTCTGVLIAPDRILFAAHCGLDFESITLGERRRAPEVTDVLVEECHAVAGAEPGRGNDLALCTLATSVSTPVTPVLDLCERNEFGVGSDVYLVGFGSDETGRSGFKRWSASRVSDINFAGELEIGGDGVDTCDGDSGGPAFVELPNGQFRVLGITSYGATCGDGGYYTDAARGIEWMEDVLDADFSSCGALSRGIPRAQRDSVARMREPTSWDDDCIKEDSPPTACSVAGTNSNGFLPALRTMLVLLGFAYIAVGRPRIA